MKNVLTYLAQQIDADRVGIPTMGGNSLLNNTLDLVYFIAGAVAVITIIAGGIFYVASSGDASRVTKAKNLILYAVVGLIIVISAFTITHFVIGRFN